MSDLHVTCVALASAVGLTPASAAAAMRCGISGITELLAVDDAVEPVMGGLVPSIGIELRGRDRLIELLVQVLEAARASLEGRADLTRLPVLLCTSEPERPSASIAGIIPSVEARLDLRLQREGTMHLARGHVSGLEALGLAQAAMDCAQRDMCLVVAADSLVDARSLLWLEHVGRLKTFSRSDGVIPGEGAAVVLVSRAPLDQPGLVVRGVGTGQDTATVLNDEPQLASGMTAAVAAALRQAEIGMHEVAFRLSDVSGETYGFEDLALVQSRLMQQTRSSQELWHPASSVGDCGAAAGLMQLAWIEQAFLRRYAPGQFALAQVSSPHGLRAAAVLSGPSHGERNVA